MQISIRCLECGEIKLVEAPEEGVRKWKSGVLIQRALPELSLDDRELLISQICPECWKNLFPPEDEAH